MSYRLSIYGIEYQILDNYCGGNSLLLQESPSKIYSYMLINLQTEAPMRIWNKLESSVVLYSIIIQSIHFYYKVIVIK